MTHAVLAAPALLPAKGKKQDRHPSSLSVQAAAGSFTDLRDQTGSFSKNSFFPTFETSNTFIREVFPLIIAK